MRSLTKNKAKIISREVEAEDKLLVEELKLFILYISEDYRSAYY